MQKHRWVNTPIFIVHATSEQNDSTHCCISFKIRKCKCRKKYDRKWTILEIVIYSLFASYHGIFTLFKDKSLFFPPKAYWDFLLFSNKMILQRQVKFKHPLSLYGHSVYGPQQMPLDYGLQFFGRKRKKIGIVICKKISVIIKAIRDIIKLRMSSTNTVMLILYLWHY